MLQGSMFHVWWQGYGCASFIAYGINVFLSWVFSRILVPECNEALAAAVIITLPIFVTAIFCFSTVIFKTDEGASCFAGAILCFGMVSSVVDFAGFALIVFTVVKASFQIPDSRGGYHHLCGVHGNLFADNSSCQLCSQHLWGLGQQG